MSKISTQISVIAATLLVSGNAIAQEKIKDGTVTGTVNQPSPAAILELESSNKGLLLPRVNLTNTKTWTLTGTVSTTGGMTVYNTNANIASTDDKYPAQGAGIYFWDGTGWVAGSPVEPWNKATTVYGATLNTQNIYQKGFVGIGDFSTQAPGAALHIKGNTDGFAVDNIIMESISTNKIGDALQILSKGFSGTAPVDSNNTYLGTFGFRFNQANNSAPELNDRARLRVMYDGPTGTTPGTSMTFATAPVRSSTANERMRITGDGNVGIGTTTPTHKLHVEGVTRTTNLTNSGHAISTADFGLYNQKNQYTRIASAVGTATAIAFYNDGDSANSFAGTNAAMMIRNGNVGINTGNTTPSNKLVVKHDSANTSGLRLENFKSVPFLATNASGDVIAATLPTEPWRVAGTTNEATSNTQSIYQNGNVGIGTTSPTHKLDVNGGIGGNYLTNGTTIPSSTTNLGIHNQNATGDIKLTTLKSNRIQFITDENNNTSFLSNSNRPTMYLQYAGVAVNLPTTVTPKASIHIGSTDSADIADGLIVARLTGNKLHEKKSAYTTDQNGAIVYVTAAASTANRTDQTENIDATGFYYYNSPSGVAHANQRWMKMNVVQPTANYRTGSNQTLDTSSFEKQAVEWAAAHKNFDEGIFSGAITNGSEFTIAADGTYDFSAYIGFNPYARTLPGNPEGYTAINFTLQSQASGSSTWTDQAGVRKIFHGAEYRWTSTMVMPSVLVNLTAGDKIRFVVNQERLNGSNEGGSYSHRIGTIPIGTNAGHVTIATGTKYTKSFTIKKIK